MCHDALKVSFEQGANFVIGSNGSGKSAILAALAVGLGARAKTTDRATEVGGNFFSNFV